jgi:hypothetical protein
MEDRFAYMGYFSRPGYLRTVPRLHCLEAEVAVRSYLFASMKGCKFRFIAFKRYAIYDVSKDSIFTLKENK